MLYAQVLQQQAVVHDAHRLQCRILVHWLFSQEGKPTNTKSDRRKLCLTGHMSNLIYCKGNACAIFKRVHSGLQVCASFKIP